MGNLSNLDLNLLRVPDALLQHGSTVRADGLCSLPARSVTPKL